MEEEQNISSTNEENSQIIIEESSVIETDEPENAIAKIDYVTVSIVVIAFTLVLMLLNKRLFRKKEKDIYSKKPSNVIDGKRTLKL